MAAVSKIVAVILFICLFILLESVYIYIIMHMYNFLCSDSLLYFFLFLSTLHSVYTRDCSCTCIHVAYMYTTYSIHVVYMCIHVVYM